MNKWDEIKANILKEKPMATRRQRFWYWFIGYQGCCEVTVSVDLGPDITATQSYVTCGLSSDESEE